jgi:hypothetical protein
MRVRLPARQSRLRGVVFRPRKFPAFIAAELFRFPPVPEGSGFPCPQVTVYILPGNPDLFSHP